mmetsp:Transcript_4169/g.6143  ORF Transcript_4169/g.6143 Transcript_4169/m.6143 type:complete len:315 (+) Transcript_4169:44-988(+)
MGKETILNLKGRGKWIEKEKNQKKREQEKNNLVLWRTNQMQISPMHNIKEHLKSLVNGHHTYIKPTITNQIEKQRLTTDQDVTNKQEPIVLKGLRSDFFKLPELLNSLHQEPMKRQTRLTTKASQRKELKKEEKEEQQENETKGQFDHPAISQVELSPQTHIVDLNTDSDEPYILARIPLDVYHQIVKNLEQERNPKMIKGSWTAREDTLLMDLVNKYGPKRWSFIASHLKGRVGKQCRERYLNHLDPNINKSEWQLDEDHIIVSMQAQLGNKWAKIAKHLNGRTPNAVKNHWNSTLSKRAERIRQKLGVAVQA